MPSITPIAGQRGLDSVRAVLRQLPPDWRRLPGSSVADLIAKSAAEVARWESGDEPIASLQRGAAYICLALDQALGGQSPPTIFAPETPEDCTDRRGPRPKAKRRYVSEGVSA